MKFAQLFSQIFITLCFFLTGCAESFVGYTGALNRYEQIYSLNDCKSDFLDEKIKSGRDLIMWNEFAGSLKRNCADYQASNSYFDAAEELYKSDVDLQNLGKKSTNVLSSVLINDNTNDYEGNTYEAIMINTYKGLNFMSLGDFSNARVEFNRALDRQRRAKDEFEKEIKRTTSELSEQNSKVKKAVLNKQTNEFIDNAYKDVFADFMAYPDFVNPFATYMAGLFFLADKDYLKARDLFKESLAMQPQNEFLRSEFELINSMLLPKAPKSKHIWLIYENGKSMQKDEFSLNIPLYLFSDKAFFAPISLPTLKAQNQSSEFLELNGAKTTQISDMDRVIKTEFQIKLPKILTISLIRTASKIYAQTQLSQKDENLGLLMGIFSIATNRSDTRSWVSLPKNFQAVRVKNSGKNAQIQMPNGDIIANLQIPKNSNAIIYLNSPTIGTINIHKILF